LAKELLDAVHFPACSLGALAAPQTFTLTPANHTQLAHHYIQYAVWTFLFFKSKRISSNYRKAASKNWYGTWNGH